MTCENCSSSCKCSKQKKLLDDFSSTGKKKPWRKYKLQSLAISRAYGFFDGLLKYSEKIADCGFCLRFEVCTAVCHFKRLIAASFCKARLCVTCQWRKSLVIRKQLLALVHAHKKNFPRDIPLLLTLTIPNVKGKMLADALTLMSKSWQKLTKRKLFANAVRSWFRALEVTYNEQRDDFHPHFHVLIMVPEAYFKVDRDLYISQKKWLELWRKSTGIEAITQVDIRKIKKSKDGAIEKLIAEVGKYATKPSSYVKWSYGELEAKPAVIRRFHYALRRRRLVGYGGLFSKLRKELKQQDVEKSDLIDVSDSVPVDCLCPICQSTLIEEMYVWTIGLKNYVQEKENPQNPWPTLKLRTRKRKPMSL